MNSLFSGLLFIFMYVCMAAFSVVSWLSVDCDHLDVRSIKLNVSLGVSTVFHCWLIDAENNYFIKNKIPVQNH